MRSRVGSFSITRKTRPAPITVNMGARNAAGSQPGSPSSPSIRTTRPIPQSPTLPMDIIGNHPPIIADPAVCTFRNAPGSQPLPPSSPSIRATLPILQSPPSSIDVLKPLPDLSDYVKPMDAHISAYGGYGDVWMGLMQIGTDISTVAVKHLRSHSTSPAERHRLELRLRREITVWKRLQHANVVRLLGTVHHNASTGMVSMWMSCGNLNTHARADLPLPRRLQIPCDIAAGLAYLHSQGITHGDLNGGNVLIDDNGNACLVDFGLSLIRAEFEGTSFITSTVGGATRYRAPDLLPSMGTMEVYTFIPTFTLACDIWSLGSVILQTLSGNVPYHDIKPDICVLMALSCGVRPHRPQSDVLTDEYWSYINQLWGDKPDSRPQANQAHTSLMALRDLHQPRAYHYDVVPRVTARISRS